MALLKDILYKVHIRSVHGSTAIDINALQIDSRNVKPGACFIAIKGVATDGHEYISKAVEQGATAIVCQHLPEQLNDHSLLTVLKPQVIWRISSLEMLVCK
jgi:UDP-N-acetylmuramoyl-L-alanyl-D-glutamate--2,6-diaminopimelate ligase